MPRRNCHCSDVSSIHLPWRASTACLGAEVSTQRAALSPAWTIWGRTARPTANARARLLNMGTSFIRTPGLDGAQQRSARKTLPGTLWFPGEAQFDDLECRGLLHAGRPGHRYGLLHCTLV